MSLGASAIPLLVGVIKRERKFRTRQMAAMLLRDLGPRAAAQLKQELTSEVGTEQRFRILEVLDVVTRRVTDELAYCLGDGSPKIRQAAYQLAERVGDPALVAVVAPHTQNADLDLAQSTIRCLAHLGHEDAARVLVATLVSAKKSDHAVACAQALGQIGDPVAVEALADLLLQKRAGFAIGSGTTRCARRRPSPCNRLRVQRRPQRFPKSAPTRRPESARSPRPRHTAGAPPPEPVLRASSANRLRLARHPPTRGRPTLPDPPGGSLGPA